MLELALEDEAEEAPDREDVDVGLQRNDIVRSGLGHEVVRLLEAQELPPPRAHRGCPSPHHSPEPLFRRASWGRTGPCRASSPSKVVGFSTLDEDEEG